MDLTQRNLPSCRPARSDRTPCRMRTGSCIGASCATKCRCRCQCW
jgi:hypothetical protein